MSAQTRGIAIDAQEVSARRWWRRIPLAVWLILPTQTPTSGVEWWQASFQGLQNFQELLGDERFIGAVIRTAFVVGIALSAEFVVGMSLAMLFFEDFPLKKLAVSAVILPISGAFMANTTKTLKAGDLMMGGGITSFNDAVVAILSGGAYANVHTVANSGGDIRGALGAVTLRSTLSSLQEPGNIVSAATGSGVTTVNADRNQVVLRLEVSGLMNIIAAHYHVGNPAVNGPVIITLSAGSFVSPLLKTLTMSDLTLVPAQGINNIGDAINAMLAGRSYLNVHTMANMGGEIRGQVGPVLLKSALNGANEVPPVMTAATGTAQAIVLGDQSAIDVTLSTTGLMNIISAHIHAGGTMENGPIIFPLVMGSFASPLKKTLTAADLTPAMAKGVNTFEDALNALIGGNTYANVHTMGNMGGEIRGPLTP